MGFRTLKLILGTVCLVFTSSVGAVSPDARLDAQRSAFRDALPQVERGDWLAVRANESLLRDYILWPDLRATYLRVSLDKISHSQVYAFLEEFGVLKPARELRYRFAVYLAEHAKYDEYLAIYRQFYQGLDIPKLDCLALEAELATDQAARITGRGLALWKVGRSQVAECDSVFEHLLTAGKLGNSEYRARFELALNAKQFSLARYLAKSLGEHEQEVAQEWLDAQNAPAKLIENYLDYADTALAKELMQHAVRRIAYKDPDTAAIHWLRLGRHFSFNDAEQQGNTQQYIALWSARARLPQAAERLANLPASHRNNEVRRWQIRNHLLFRRWTKVIGEIQALPQEEGSKEEWRYWRAYAHLQANERDRAHAILDSLATERSYYGFLAADLRRTPYSLTAETQSFDINVAERLLAIQGLQRARELFFVGLEGKGRSEWDAAVSQLNANDQVQAALLASQWGWHSRAIATVAKAGEFDDLELRYPLPWREDFERQANAAGIDSSWSYGIARSESLFMRDIRSSAGAIGLMQLMPATGREAAREISLPWVGAATLTNSVSNIRLGTYYLGKMLKRFGDNRILATAAYNAGPARVERWLPSEQDLDARIWIENIPFNETRSYVRRVLTDDAIFHWRQTGQIKRLSSALSAIAANSDDSATTVSD